MGDSAEAVEAGRVQKSGDGRDRREQERFECNGLAEVIVEDASFLFRGIIRDLSATGCYIQSKARLRLARGTTVQLRFSVNSQELRLPARIMIIRPGAGAGFRFVDLGVEKQEHLATLSRKLNPVANPHTNASPAVPVGQISRTRRPPRLVDPH